ncbi:MAG TPA: cold-shock protein [Alphaproteobacteria bacterium]|jgi:CspA family cold shock protein
MSDESSGDGPATVREVSGVVKWFNAVKGFGFITPSDGANDAFLHLSVLREAGFANLLPGSTVRCEVCERPKGLQVTRLIDVDDSTAEPEPPSAAPAHDLGREPAEPGGEFVEATVKWFNADKGYGFVCQANNERDVFIHMVTLRRSGVRELEAGQSVRVRIAEGPKGPQATEVRIQ